MKTVSKSIKIKTNVDFDISDLPESVKQLLADKDNDGKLDVVEDAMEAVVQNETKTEIEINGVKYNTWDEVPEEWQKYKNRAKMTAEEGGLKVETEDDKIQWPKTESESKPVISWPIIGLILAILAIVILVLTR
jgi:hypothetical protein